MFKLSREYIELVTSALSGRSGIQFERGGEWKYNPRQKVLTYNPIDIQNLPPGVAKGLILHELGHAMFTEPTKQTEIEKEYPSIQDMYNIAEDARIEKKLSGTFGSFSSENIGEKNTVVSPIALAQYKKEYTHLTPYQKIARATALSREGISNTEAWNFFMDSESGFDYKKRQEVAELYRKISQTITDATHANSTQEVKQLVDEGIAPLLSKYLDKKEQPSMKGAGAEEIQELKKKGGGAGKKTNSVTIPPYQEAKALIKPYARVLAEKLKQILSENAHPVPNGRYRSGLLSGNRAVDVCMGHERPFMRRQEASKQTYKFVIALDNSGSMRGAEKSVNSYLSAVMLDEVATLLGFGYDALMFGDEVIQCMDRSDIEKYRADGGSTDDTSAIEVIEKHTEKGDNSLIFIIGDGSGKGLSENEKYFRKIKEKGGQVFGIGLMSNHVLDQYPNPVVVETPEQLIGAIVRKINGVIHRSVIS